mgnify:CR=1 FL=1
MFRKYSTIDYPPRTIELQETTEHPASSYGQPVLVDRDGNAWDRWMVIPIEPVNREWNDWNVALWINNDQGLYSWCSELCREVGVRNAAIQIVDAMEGETTPDGAAYDYTSVIAALQGLAE